MRRALDVAIIALVAASAVTGVIDTRAEKRSEREAELAQAVDFWEYRVRAEFQNIEHSGRYGLDYVARRVRETAGPDPKVTQSADSWVNSLLAMQENVRALGPPPAILAEAAVSLQHAATNYVASARAMAEAARAEGGLRAHALRRSDALWAQGRAWVVHAQSQILAAHTEAGLPPPEELPGD